MSSTLSQIQACRSPVEAAGLIRAHAVEMAHLLPDPQGRRIYWQRCNSMATILELPMVLGCPIETVWRPYLVLWGFRLVEAEDPAKATTAEPLTWERAVFRLAGFEVFSCPSG